LRATTTKNQGKQLSVHHSKYNVLHLDIMKQAFCHKNWTVPNCHVTEIDFSQRLESKQASKKQHIQMVNRIILIFSSHPDRRIHADWIKHWEVASEPSRSLPRAGIRPTTLRRVRFPPVKTSSHCGVANSSLILFVVVFSLHTMVPARESDPENRDFEGRDNDC
jgi:hypothetical protein